MLFIEVIKMSKYLKFELLEQKPKTKVIEVISKSHNNRLGIIKWYGAWRQYTFFPESDTLFNTECLNDVITYIGGL